MEPLSRNLFPHNQQHRKLSLVLYLLFLQTQALHCHRKHDHSTDILLRSDISNLGSAGHLTQGDISNETPGDAAKLVQIEDSESSDISVDDFSSSSSNVNKSYSVGGVNVTRIGGGRVVAFCPSRCACDISATNQLQVICSGHFVHDFPLEKLRKDVEVLTIEPEVKCGKIPGQGDRCNRTENQISLGPIYQHLRLLKELRIRFSQVPNVGHRTMWGLSGLRVLDLSHNKLTNVVEQNFEGLYSLKELCLANNQVTKLIKSRPGLNSMKSTRT